MLLKLLKRKKVDPKAELQAVLGDHALPSFPALLMSALEKVRDSDAPLSEVADHLSSDPGVSVRLLGTVNSAAFALKYRVRSIHHAVSLLGRGELESILISMAVRETLPRETTRGFVPQRFWTTSARRAATARALADLIDPSTCSECFTAALLQDMALPLLAQRRGQDYGPILESWHADGEDLVSMERSSFGWDHAQVANWMCDEWKFPTAIAEAIGVHHGDDDDETPGLAGVNLVAPLREVNEKLGVEQLVEMAHDGHGLDKDTTVRVIEVSFEQAEAIAALFT